jgi:hypothetical protein
MLFLQQGFRDILPLLLFLLIVEEAVSPPVTQKKKDVEDNSVDEKGDEDPVSSDFCNSLSHIKAWCLFVVSINHTYGAVGPVVSTLQQSKTPARIASLPIFMCGQSAGIENN